MWSRNNLLENWIRLSSSIYNVMTYISVLYCDNVICIDNQNAINLTVPRVFVWSTYFDITNVFARMTSLQVNSLILKFFILLNKKDFFFNFIILNFRHLFLFFY